MPSCGVCVSVTFLDHVKTNKHIFNIFFTIGYPHHSSFSTPNVVAIFRWEPPKGGVECRCGRQKNAILDEYLASLYTGVQCCQPYESRSVKNKAATDGGERRAHRDVRRPLFAQDDDEVFVTGSTLYAGDGGQPLSRTQPPWS